MRYLGIDYGTKKSGLAFSNEEATFAFPLSVIATNERTFSVLKELIAEKDIQAIVLGESKGLNGKDNSLMEVITTFKEKLEKTFGLPVYLENELFTSVEARRVQGGGELTDASAAALILTRFLTHKKND